MSFADVDRRRMVRIERWIVEGLQKVQADMPVTPQAMEVKK